ncbi:MAG: glycosyltransferase family 2 protein [Pirellulales bacterium]
MMLHPDYQYSPKLITAMAAMATSGEFDVVLGSRILGVGALAGGMPFYKYVFNRGLTLSQNLLCGHKLSEYHTGYRAFTRRVLLELPLNENSDDFVFDNQMLAQAIYFKYRIGEMSCPTKYFEDASSINFRRSCKYGLGVLGTSALFRLNRMGLAKTRIYAADGRKLARSVGARRLLSRRSARRRTGAGRRGRGASSWRLAPRPTPPTIRPAPRP